MVTWGCSLFCCSLNNSSFMGRHGICCILDSLGLKLRWCYDFEASCGHCNLSIRPRSQIICSSLETEGCGMACNSCAHFHRMSWTSPCNNVKNWDGLGASMKCRKELNLEHRFVVFSSACPEIEQLCHQYQERGYGGCYSVHFSCSPTSTDSIYVTKLLLHYQNLH
jgi:hypothetical protein